MFDTCVITVKLAKIFRTHVKKFTATQDGRQVYRTLHYHFFGKDKVNTMVNGQRHPLVPQVENLSR